MNRDEFLTRVRQAVSAGESYRPHVRHDVPAGVGYIGAGPDPVARLVDEIAAVGGQPRIVNDMQAARQALAEIVEPLGPKSALCWQHPVLDRLGLAPFLAERGIERLTYAELSPLPPAEQRRKALAADIGITSVSYAVAETGTLAHFSGPGAERMASLVPPVHVAIVTVDQILPDQFDLFTRLGQLGASGMPTNVALVTGPSKTGDIEMRLTTGVHGPGQWHVLIVRDAN